MNRLEASRFDKKFAVNETTAAAIEATAKDAAGNPIHDATNWPISSTTSAPANAHASVAVVWVTGEDVSVPEF